MDSDKKNENGTGKQSSGPPFSFSNPYEGKLIQSKRLTAMDWNQDVRHYEIEIDPSMAFSPGDSLAVLPCNPLSVVQEFLKRVNISPDLIIESISLRDPKCKLSHFFFKV